MTDDEYEQFIKQKEIDLKPRLTDEFLETLLEAAKIDGWSNDFSEIHSFVKNVFDMAGKELESFSCYFEENVS